MYFVTDEPIVFNIETGVIIQCRKDLDNRWSVDLVFSGMQSIYSGSRQECEDFVYSIAGWVGAVNPMAKDPLVKNDELETPSAQNTINGFRRACSRFLEEWGSSPASPALKAYLKAEGVMIDREPMPS